MLPRARLRAHATLCRVRDKHTQNDAQDVGGDRSTWRATAELPHLLAPDGSWASSSSSSSE